MVHASHILPLEMKSASKDLMLFLKIICSHSGTSLFYIITCIFNYIWITFFLWNSITREIIRLIIVKLSFYITELFCLRYIWPGKTWLWDKRIKILAYLGRTYNLNRYFSYFFRIFLKNRIKKICFYLKAKPTTNHLITIYGKIIKSKCYIIKIICQNSKSDCWII